MDLYIYNSSDNPLPAYETTGSAGLDIRAFIESPVSIMPGTRSIIPTGLFLEVPVGHEIQVRPRSGLAAKNGITVLNTPGTIDSDYRGEIMVILANLGSEIFTVEPGDRIAQMVLAPVIQAAITEVSDKTELSSTVRGEGGFGSTGRT